MPDLIYIGKDVQSFQKSERFAGYDRVVLNLDDNNYVSSPSVTVVDASKWDQRSNGQYKFIYIAETDRWRTPFNTNANRAALTQNYGITPYYSDVTSPKDGDIITVTKSTVNESSSVKAEITRSGSTLTANCPLVKPEDRQKVADNLLKQVYSFEYQPFSANGAYMNPAAEIGDAINAYSIYSGLFEQETIFNRLMLSNIGSAINDEAEVEMQYENNTDRRYNRKLAETSAEFAILADRISSTVTNEQFQAALNTMANQIDAKVSESGGNTNSFAWSLDSNGFYLYSNGALVFKCDRSGITVVGDATITGEVFASNIRSDAVDGYGGSFSGLGITPASIETAQCSSGVVQSLGYADVFHAATRSGTQSYPSYFTAGSLYGTSSVASQTFSVENSSGEERYHLNDHYHSFTEQNGKIIIGIPHNSISIDDRSFNVADTQTYRDGVAAVTVVSQEVIIADSNTIRDYTSEFDCDLTGKTYTPSGSTNQFGRINIKNSNGTVLKKLRVQFPAGAVGPISNATVQPSTDTINDIRTDLETGKVFLKTLVKGYSSSSSTTPIFNQDNVECDITTAADFIKNVFQTSYASVLETDSTNYRSYNNSYAFGTNLYNPNLSTGGNQVFGRVGLYSQSDSLLKTYRFSLDMSVASASTASDPSDYYQSGNTWYLKVHVKNSSTEIYQGSVNVQQAVNYGGSLDWNIYQHYDGGEPDGWDCVVTTGSGQRHTFWSPSRIYA